MRISEAGIVLIKKYEGLRLAAYKCPAGKWTIGYGHTYNVKPGDKITEQDAEDLLLEDIQNSELHVNSYNPMYHWSQIEFDALVSFTFNCGSGNLYKLLKGGKRSRDEIASAILLYNKSNGAPLDGLTKRRKEEQLLFLFGRARFYPKYEGLSVKIDEVLSVIGAASDYDKTAKIAWKKRIPIAKANGISGYTGTSAQNLRLIRLSREGHLQRPM